METWTWRTWPSEVLDPGASFRATLALLAAFAFACYLTLCSWTALPFLLIVAVEVSLLVKVFILLPEMRKAGFTCRLTLCFGRLGLMLLLMTTFSAAWWACSYLRLTDPHTTIQWVGLKSLGREIQLRRDVYVVMLQDGYIAKEFEGTFEQTICQRTQCRKERVSVAPIFEKRPVNGSFGGALPLAWALGEEEVASSYCGVGVCGIYAGTIEDINLGGVLPGEGPAAVGKAAINSTAVAAKRAAVHGGFPFRDKLPAIRSMDIIGTARTAALWHHRFWPLFWSAVFLALSLDADAGIAAWDKRRQRQDPERRPLMA